MKSLKFLGLIFLLELISPNNKYPNYELIEPPEKIINLQKSPLKPKEIVYKNFTEIDFDEFANEEVDSAYGNRIDRYSYLPRIENINKLEEIVFKEADGSNKNIREFSITEAIEFGINLVSEKISWTDDDSTLKNLPVEDYLEIGKGDCDVYSNAFISAFHVLKKYNKNLSNIYVSNENFGGIVMTHSWNSIVISLKDRTIVTHIDLTSYDKNKNIEIEKGYYIPKNDLWLKARFLMKTGFYSESYEYYNRLLNEATDSEMRWDILSEIYSLAYVMDYKNKII